MSWCSVADWKSKTNIIKLSSAFRQSLVTIIWRFHFYDFFLNGKYAIVADCLDAAGERIEQGKTSVDLAHAKKITCVKLNGTLKGDVSTLARKTEGGMFVRHNR